ncbi:hypothetical protein [Bifidobacterium samirii]|uniref:Uncharacterized protein n=1 Tax=Bifidobacterium samirii TaxID=2306974 RepID=A0A430FTR0_9BIFI|nr:hypothetical protein [Bifidobacterium samirii]RSX56218.1 hypothetical protein D2E24_1207 [Bifidobacterium samirii]
MPWWIWLCLALFMIVMIVAGAAYAVLHGIRGVRRVGETGARISGILATMSDADAAPAPTPGFTRPLTSVADAYTDTQQVKASRDQEKRERHARVWSRWNRV